MSKAKMEAAKELIQAKQYTEARAILKTVDHPKAREWEAQLDKVAPQRKPRKSRVGLLIFAVLVLIAAAASP